MKQEKIEFFNHWFTKTVGKPMYNYQVCLLTEHQNLNIINKSRQTGISTLMACYGLYNAMLGKTVLIISPSDRQSKHVMSIVQQFLKNTKHDSLVEEMKTSIHFSTGGKIFSLPNSPSNIRGYKSDLIILDEAAHFLNDTDREVMEAISPSLSRGGELWLVSTPFGEKGLFWEYFTKKENTYKLMIHWSECEDLKENIIKNLCPDPLVFAQEYENKFLSNIETEFPWELLHSCINPELEYQNLESLDNLYLGIDVGRKIDQTAIVGVQKTSQQFIVRFKNVMQGTEYQVQQHHIESLMHTKKIVRINIDESGIGSMMAENLSKKNPSMIRPYTFTAELKEQLVINLKKMLVNKTIMLPDDPQLLNAIHSIKRTQSSTGHIKFDAERSDLTGHADTAFALMLAIHDAEKQRPAFRIM